MPGSTCARDAAAAARAPLSARSIGKKTPKTLAARGRRALVLRRERRPADAALHQPAARRAWLLPLPIPRRGRAAALAQHGVRRDQARGARKSLSKLYARTAWDSKKIKKLTVNTCSLDHKSAIYLYQKYGFTPVKYKDLEKTV